MVGLTARKIADVPSPEGIQADIGIMEPNGDEHVVRCLCKFSGGIDVGEVGDGTLMLYLNDRYGYETVKKLVRQVTLANN